MIDEPFDQYPLIQELLKALGEQDHARVLESTRELLEIDPSNADFHLYRGGAYLGLSQYDQARECLMKAIDMAKEQIILIHEEYQSKSVTWGNVVEISGEEHYLVSVQERLRDGAKVLLAEIWRHKGDIECFETILKESLRDSPESVFLHYVMAVYYVENGQNEQAITVCKAGAKLPSYCGNTDDWRNLAEACRHLGLNNECAIIAEHQNSEEEADVE